MILKDAKILANVVKNYPFVPKGLFLESWLALLLPTYWAPSSYHLSDKPLQLDPCCCFSLSVMLHHTGLSSVDWIMRYKDLRFWDKLGKNCRFFITNNIKGSLHPLAKNLLIPVPSGKCSAPAESLPKKFYPLPLHNNFNVITQ